VFFGMLLATTVGVFFIPLFFTAIRSLSERGARLRSTSAAPVALPTPAEGD
jgi:hypothetical protein